MKALVSALLLLAPPLPARDVAAMLQDITARGAQVRANVNLHPAEVFWADHAESLVFRTHTGKERWRFDRVDLQSGAITPAFDHTALAALLDSAASPEALPLSQVRMEGNDARFLCAGKGWIWKPGATSLANFQPPAAALVSPRALARLPRRGGKPVVMPVENATDACISIEWISPDRKAEDYGTIAAGDRREMHTYAGHLWAFKDAHGKALGGIAAMEDGRTVRITGPVPDEAENPPGRSPDGRWDAFIAAGNLHLQPSAGGDTVALTRLKEKSGSYSAPFHWSPDSKHLVCFFTPAVETRKISIVQSSPPGRVQPMLLSFDYPKPGDPIHQPTPHLFDIAALAQVPVDTALFPNPWTNSHPAWSADSQEFSFLYNQRGHQLMRLISLSAADGKPRVILEEKAEKFIDYSQKLYLKRLPDTREIIWASERTGWNHLYLYDEAAGKVKHAVTTGGWNVREVVTVDAAARTVLLKGVGMVAGQDPYFTHYIRVNIDDGRITRLTDGDGTHHLDFSPDGKFYTDTFSRTDLPPVMELRRSSDGKRIAELARVSPAAVVAASVLMPERFTAKGRDGKTDIYGLIYRPTRFDPTKRYPVVEVVYPGPHDFFVPKEFNPFNSCQEIADYGFIVVKIDGMGTNWRSRAFHEICWKNLMDAGFPDRIPWIKSAAATRPWMNLSRMGIIGGSAGGQAALAALLRHGDFYRAAVADSGCHDNRMDKAWWNEAWMGWPVDESYARNSNVTHAADLKGDLLLMFGELDRNVDPASSAQVAAALQKAGKSFEYLPVMNAGHCASSPGVSKYGATRAMEFLLRKLAPEE